VRWKPIYREHALKEKPALFIFLVILALPTLITCAQQEQGPSKGAIPKKAAVKKPLVKMQYLAGEVLAVHKAQKTILVRGKDSELLFRTNSRTSVKIDGEPKRLADVTTGMKAAIRYIEVGDKNIARSLVISTLPPEKKTSVEEPAKSDLPTGRVTVQP
jgi:hypothetical protein